MGRMKISAGHVFDVAQRSPEVNSRENVDTLCLQYLRELHHFQTWMTFTALYVNEIVKIFL